MREKYMLALANLVNGSELGYEDRSSIPEYKKDIEDYVDSLEEKNQKYKEVIFKIKMIISTRIKKYQQKIDNEIDMGSQGDYFKICGYRENIKFLKDILKEVELK